MCVCVCVCVRERERERERESVSVRVSVSVSVCVCLCVSECVCARASMHMKHALLTSLAGSVLPNDVVRSLSADFVFRVSRAAELRGVS